LLHCVPNIDERRTQACQELFSGLCRRDAARGAREEAHADRFSSARIAWLIAEGETPRRFAATRETALLRNNENADKVVRSLPAIGEWYSQAYIDLWDFSSVRFGSNLDTETMNMPLNNQETR